MNICNQSFADENRMVYCIEARGLSQPNTQYTGIVLPSFMCACKQKCICDDDQMTMEFCTFKLTGAKKK